MARAIYGPEFSEFSLGYSITENLSSYMGRPSWAPRFPTTVQEKRFGFDVALMSGSVLFFLQFKRSDAVVADHGTLKEKRHRLIGAPPRLSHPYYRVHLRGTGDKEQHQTLERLERYLRGHSCYIVRYAVPCFHKMSSLDEYYRLGRVGSALTPIRFIRPSIISLPHARNHIISYDSISPTGYQFSSAPVKISGLESLEEILKEANEVPFYLAIQIARKLLDEFALESRLEGVSHSIEDEDLIRWFGLPPGTRRSPDGSLGQNVLSQLRTLRSMLATPIEAPDTSQAISDRTSLDYLEDYHVADQRCWQIIGSPLLVSPRS